MSTQTLPPLANKLENVFCYHSFGAAGSGRAYRWSNPQVIEQGVESYVTGAMMNNYAAGYRRFYIDNPFGKDTDQNGNPQVTFFGSRIVSSRSPWRRNFNRIWKTFNRRPGVYSLVYIGNPYWPSPWPPYEAVDTDSDWQNCRNIRAAWAMLESVAAPLIAAGFKGLAIDATSHLQENVLFAKYLWSLSARGIDVYVEAPHYRQNKPWMQAAGFKTISTTWFDINWQPNWRETKPDESLPGSIILETGTPPFPEAVGRPPEEWYGRWVRETLARGLHPAISPWFGNPGENPVHILGLDE